LKARGAFCLSGWYLVRPSATEGEGLGALGAAGAIVFLAARLGLDLQTRPSDAAVLWPASGIAAGISIVRGRRTLPALVISVVAGTVAANLMGERSPWGFRRENE
jgi:integral membrane sensor domain MASE1